MPSKPETLHRRTVTQSNLFRVEAVGLRFSNGAEVEFECLARGSGNGAVLIVPVTAKDEVLLVREYAVGTDRYELGLPKGRLEAGEEPLTGANRELREEVGYAARELTELRRLSLAPGYIAHCTHVILARDLYAAPLDGDEPEPLEVVPWPLSDLPGLLANDELSEARSIAALYLTREKLYGETE